MGIGIGWSKKKKKKKKMKKRRERERAPTDPTSILHPKKEGRKQEKRRGALVEREERDRGALQTPGRRREKKGSQGCQVAPKMACALSFFFRRFESMAMCRVLIRDCCLLSRIKKKNVLTVGTKKVYIFFTW